jgi:hypothetical protein
MNPCCSYLGVAAEADQTAASTPYVGHVLVDDQLVEPGPTRSTSAVREGEQITPFHYPTARDFGGGKLATSNQLPQA